MVILFCLRLNNCLISKIKNSAANFPENKMQDFKDKYDDLINRGYLINFYEEDRNYKITGKYHAFGVTIKKNGKNVLNHFSKKSCEEALIVAHELLEIRNRYVRNF